MRTVNLKKWKNIFLGKIDEETGRLCLFYDIIQLLGQLVKTLIADFEGIGRIIGL